MSARPLEHMETPVRAVVPLDQRPKVRWANIKSMFSESLDGWQKHNGGRLGAALAFYSLLSITPLVLVVIAVGGLAFGQKAAESQLVWQIEDLIGPDGAAGIQAILHGTRNTTHGIIATAIGLLTLLFGASGVMVELRDALNLIWEVPAAQTTGWRSIMRLMRERLFSFAMLLAIGFLLLVSLLVNAGISAMGSLFQGWVPISKLVDLHLFSSVVSLVVTTFLFAAIFKVIPDVHLEWRDVFLGAVTTAVLFTVGKFLIALYMGRAGFSSTYGAAASLVVLIVWVYYSAQIFYFGAEFTRRFTLRHGSQCPNPAVCERTS